MRPHKTKIPLKHKCLKSLQQIFKNNYILCSFWRMYYLEAYQIVIISDVQITLIAAPHISIVKHINYPIK